MTERRSKYNARRIEIDGITFDSHAEAARYRELRLLERAGEIRDLRVHPRYEIIPAFTDNTGRKHRATYYEADFEYREGGVIAVEDVKGVETALFKIKRKLLLLCRRDLEFRIVRAK